MTMLGVFWAAFAPLLMLPLVWLVRRIALGRLPARRAWGLAALAVLGPVLALWVLDRRDFTTVCEREARAVIRMRALADGIYLASPTANSFGMRYLHDEGFVWMEAPSLRRRGATVRYERGADGRIAERELDGPPQARFEVREAFVAQPDRHVSLSTVQVIDRQSGAQLASAGSANFDGGRARWLLGAWGTSSCPSARSDSGGFRSYYHLARDTLRPAR